MTQLKKAPKRIWAIILVAVFLIGTLPSGIFDSIAAKQSEFTIKIKDYSGDAKVTLTQDGESKQVNAENGKAVFQDVDTEISFKLQIKDMVGYENFSEEGIHVEETDTSYTATVIEIEKKQIAGTVELEGEDSPTSATVTYTAYDGKVSGTTKPDSDGKFSFDAYKGVKYSIAASAGDKYEMETTSVTTSDDTSDVNLKLKVKTFTITTTAGEHGSVTNGNQTVKYGEDAEDIVVTAHDDYCINELFVDETKIDNATGTSEYNLTSQFENVTNNHTIRVTFKHLTFKVVFNYDAEGGKITHGTEQTLVSAGGNVDVEYGSEIKFDVTAEKGYHIKNLSIKTGDIVSEKIKDGNNEETTYSDSISEKTDHTVTVEFTINKYDITIEDADHGQVTIDPEQGVVNYKGAALITIIPNDGYDIDQLFVNEKEINITDVTETNQGDYKYTLSEIVEDKNIKVLFKEIESISSDGVDPSSNDYFALSFSDNHMKNANKKEYIVGKDGDNNGWMTITPKSPYKRIKLEQRGKADESYKITGEGTKDYSILYVSTKQRGGWIAVPTEIHFIADYEVPEIAKINKIPNTKYNNADYTINVAVSDIPAGVRNVYYSETNDFNTAKPATKVDGTENEYTFTTQTGVDESNDNDEEREYNNRYFIWAEDNVKNVTPSNDVSIIVDRTLPTVDKFEFYSNSDNLTVCNFGTFSNNDIMVKVFASDTKSEIDANSGIGTIQLYADDKLYGEAGEAKVITDEKTKISYAEFTLKAEDFRNAKKISAKATDIAGNDSEIKKPTDKDVEKNVNSDNVQIESNSPTIEVTYPEKSDSMNQNTVDGKDWYKENIDFDITIEDTDSGEDANSGIKEVEVKINGKTVEAEAIKINDEETGSTVDNRIIWNGTGTNTNKIKTDETKINKVHLKVNTSQGLIEDDGSYTIVVTAKDNAGNDAESNPKTIYKDTNQPSIASFTFDAEGYHDDKPLEGAESTSPVVKTAYGFYFKEATSVFITAQDASPSSGVKSITYYTVDKDKGKSEEKTELVDSDNRIDIVIPANFKGQIYAKATDNVDNITDEYVSPDKTIVEDVEKHKESSSISYKLEKTSRRDGQGNPLYNNTTKVGVTIIDTYSGIRKIEWEILPDHDDKHQAGYVEVDNDGSVSSKPKNPENGIIYTDSCLGSWSKTMEKDKDGKNTNLVTKLSNTITVSNNSNNIRIRFTLTDRAGNVTKTAEQTLSIDKTKPIVFIQMNENDDNTYAGYFKTDRTADIYVYERNFDDDFDFDITRTNDNDSTSRVRLYPNFKKIDHVVINDVEYYVYKMSCKLTNDGDYTFSANVTDMAKNKTKDNKIKYSSNKTKKIDKQNDADRKIDKKFTIDKTMPQISVSYDNNSAQNGKYFNKYRTATITVKEHNFTSDNNRIVYTRTATKDGKSISMPQVSGWSKNGNTYTATIHYNADGDYKFGMDLTDKAGNTVKDQNVNYVNGREVSKDFTIDTTIIKPTIGGVKDKNSYRDKVIPTILVDDVNFASATVKLVRTRMDDKNREVTDKYIVNKPVNRVVVREDTFKKIRENDGLYTLTVSMTDKAGNSSEDSIKFTVNRFGSVYVFSDDLAALKDAYVQEVTGKIVISEYNPNKLIKGSLKVEILKDGNPLDKVVLNPEPVINDKAKIGSSGWYQYDYVFDNSNFAEDGIYTMTVTSKDEAGNTPQSSTESEMMFRVDSKTPNIVSIIGLEEARVRATEQEVKYSVYDAIGLQSIEVYVDGKVKDSINKFEDASNYTGKFVLGEGYNQNVKLVITDCAGNVTDTSSSSFNPEFDFNEYITVSKNIFVLWYSNKPLFWGSIGAVVAAAGLASFLIGRKRKKNVA